LKPGKLDKNLSAIIKSTYYLREKSDYDDFFIASKADVETQLKNAEYFVNEVKKYLTTILAKEL
jgi:uncharacterized protein (UPF0332 family)